MKKLSLLASSAFIAFQSLSAQDVTISVDASADNKTVSPYIYGRNNNLSDKPSSPTSASNIQMLKDAGVTFFREFGGNNGTKYNWRKKLTSHPDWYNNNYTHDWDFTAQEMQDNFPGAQGMWSFQLIGYAASNTENNFNDWEYNQSGWWTGVGQNLAGGGIPDEEGEKAKTEGDIDLYLEEWPADSSVAILDHWFGDDGLGLDKSTIQYWSMDNEPEIWNGTHDDVMPDLITAEEFMQRYFELAKKAREKFPEIKLCGPIAANEWQWYAWNNSVIEYKGAKYPWLEYFILRCAEEQKETGVRMLDVVDLHFYPNLSKSSDLLQSHRVYFDKDYDYPDANGVKLTTGGWDDNITNEYIFERCNEWLTKYMGEDHNIGLGLTEYGTPYGYDEVMVNAITYASILEVFAENNVEIFTPFFWKTGMWEVLHLFTNYSYSNSVKAESDNEEMVSAFTTINSAKDSLTVILINRSETETKNTDVNIANFTLKDGNYESFQLADLPANETFKSHTKNALVASTASVANQTLTVSLPPLSVTAVVLSPEPVSVTDIKEKVADVKAYPVPVHDELNIRSASRINKLEIIDQIGKTIKTADCNSYFEQIDCSALSNGVYTVYVYTAEGVAVKQLIK